MSETQSTSQQALGLTVAVDFPSARVLADQAAVVADLQYVMDCCKRLLAELGRPEQERDGVVPLALWSSAVIAYGRCFSAGDGSGLTDDDVRSLPLQGAVLNFHQWVMGERGKLIEQPADPFEAAKIGAALTREGHKERRVEGIAVFSNSRVLIDSTGVGQLGGLASELAKQTAGKAKKQQHTVLTDAQRLDIEDLYKAPPLQAADA